MKKSTKLFILAIVLWGILYLTIGLSNGPEYQEASNMFWAVTSLMVGIGSFISLTIAICLTTYNE